MKCVSILLIEDDKKLCEEFKNHINSREDVNLIGITNSSYTAIDIVKSRKPIAIIVDLQLFDGVGSGYNFLSQIQTLNLPYTPIIAINTNIKNDKIFQMFNNNLVDFIFYKKQKEYSIKSVIDDIVFLIGGNILGFSNSDSSFRKEILEIRSEDIDIAIKLKLDNLGIDYNLIGSTYLIDCLNALLKGKISKEFSVLQYIAKKYEVCSNTVGRSIQRLINDTWDKSSINHLKEQYTARINYQTGVPTPMEFVSYYHKIIRDSLL